MSICPKGGYMKKSKKSNDVDALDVEEKKDAVVDGEKSAEQNPHDEVVANKDVPVSEQTQAEEGKPAAEESPMTEEVPVEAESSQQQEESVAEENKATDAPTENQQPSDESSAQEKSQDEQVTPAEEVVDKKSKKEKKEKKSKKSANEEPKSEDAGVEESEKSEDKKDSSDKKKAGKEKKSKDKSAVKAERKQKVGGYISSLLKYFNIITILPLTCIFYVIFFASDIVDGVAFVQNNKIMVAVMVSILTALLVIWMIDNRNKRRVCSLDAFLLIGLLLSFGMILQCVILGHFKTFDITAILTLITTLLVLVLLTIRLCMFKHEEQAKDDDARYVAKSQLGLYFKVIFSKYALFITTMCMVGVLLILIVGKIRICRYKDGDGCNDDICRRCACAYGNKPVYKDCKRKSKHRRLYAVYVYSLCGRHVDLLLHKQDIYDTLPFDRKRRGRRNMAVSLPVYFLPQVVRQEIRSRD